jgi:hypothetical protein
MDLIEFRGTIYGKYEHTLYAFEPTWDSFRPIQKVGWDGSAISIQDSLYKKDLFSPFYGYESLVQKELCRRLIQTTELDDAREIVDPLEFWKWCGETEAKWWRDRPCVFANSCVSRELQDWRRYLKYLNSKAKTLRHPPKGRVTRRLVPK